MEQCTYIFFSIHSEISYFLTCAVVIHLKPRLDTFREASGNIEKDWLLGATKHPASFNAIMYCGGTIYAKEDLKFYNVRRAEHACLMYKLAALNTINEHLRGDSLAAVADEIMLAVLILMHVDGVRKN
jgi:hypothetical protein